MKIKVGKVLLNSHSTNGYLEVVGLTDNNRVTVECDGYIHEMSAWTIYEFKNTMTTMIESEYIRYLNENIFNNTVLLAIKKVNSNSIRDKSTVLVVNKTNNAEYICRNPMKANINRILSKTSKGDIYLSRIMESLGEKYDYSKTVCASSTGKSIVTCPEHGDFEIAISNTLYKKCGCPGCASGGFRYGRSGFVDLCNKKSKDGILYLMKCNPKNEDVDGDFFYKIGITTRSAMIRSWYIPYNTKTLISIHGDPRDIYDSELTIHKLLSKHSYTPSLKFKGITECFKFDTDEEAMNCVLEVFNNTSQKKETLLII